MKKVIVTTTINHPTEAILKYAALKDWTLVIVGDLKTPADYRVKDSIYLTPVHQYKLYPVFSEIMGWNNDCRRTVGFLYAIKELGADIVATVDDDNIPLEGWGDNLIVNKAIMASVYHTDNSVFDPLAVTNNRNLWYRGFPLPLLKSRHELTVSHEMVCCKIQSDFWNGNPDVDAICRFVIGDNCTFKKHIPFTSNKPSPFNSQNTFLHKDVLPDYFPFPFIERLCDIWASYYTQMMGHKVIYGQASVEHRRNTHDLIRDMKMEYLGYEKGIEICNDFERLGPVAVTSRLPERTMRAFEEYRRCYE